MFTVVEIRETVEGTRVVNAGIARDPSQLGHGVVGGELVIVVNLCKVDGGGGGRVSGGGGG